MAGDPLQGGVGDDQVVLLLGHPGGEVGRVEFEAAAAGGGSGVFLACAVEHLRGEVVAGDPCFGPALGEEGGAKSELEEYLSSGYGIFAGRKVEWATIRFTPLAARWVSAQRWHSKQKARTEGDGSYVLEVPYANDRELLMDVLKFGPEAEVLAPPALRERAASQLREAAKRY